MTSRYAVPDRLAFVVPDSDHPQVFLMRLPDGPPLVLEDTAAVIWVLAADGEVDVISAVGSVVGRPGEEVASQVQDYLRDLERDGLLMRHD